MTFLPLPLEKLVQKWLPQRGSSILNSLLEQRDPARIVQDLSGDDFFWLIKAIGEDDCLPVLELASVEQWEYLLDLEIWKKDRLDPAKTINWLKRLAQADSERLAKWLLEDGRDVFSYCLYRLAEIVLKEEDSTTEAPPGYSTIDGVFFFKAFSSDDQATIEELLKQIAARDFSAYQHLMHELAAIIPAETEEELYRQRNVRTAEHGFVPYEEALSVYSPLPVEALGKEEKPLPPGAVVIKEERLPVPAAPVMLLDGGNLLVQILSRTEDHLFRDRLRLEYAGLSNKILVSEALEEVPDREVLVSAWMRAGNYIHLTLSFLHGKDLAEVEKTLRHHQLETIFRVGWGFAVRLRDRAREWVKSSWSHTCGRAIDFWGSPWAERLTGLMASRPAYYDGNTYRDFTTPEEIKKGEEFLEQLRLLDLILRRLHVRSLGEGPIPTEIETFHPLFFNPWARRILGDEPSIKPLKLREAVKFFQLARAGEKHPPYRMEKFKNLFISDFMDGAKDLPESEQELLRRALSCLWEDFVQIYENVEEKNLDGRFSPYLLMEKK